MANIVKRGEEDTKLDDIAFTAIFWIERLIILKFICISLSQYTVQLRLAITFLVFTNFCFGIVITYSSNGTSTICFARFLIYFVLFFHCCFGDIEVYVKGLGAFTSLVIIIISHILLSYGLLQKFATAKPNDPTKSQELIKKLNTETEMEPSKDKAEIIKEAASKEEAEKIRKERSKEKAHLESMKVYLDYLKERISNYIVNNEVENRKIRNVQNLNKEERAKKSELTSEKIQEMAQNRNNSKHESKIELKATVADQKEVKEAKEQEQLKPPGLLDQKGEEIIKLKCGCGFLEMDLKKLTMEKRIFEQALKKMKKDFDVSVKFCDVQILKLVEEKEKLIADIRYETTEKEKLQESLKMLEQVQEENSRKYENDDEEKKELHEKLGSVYQLIENYQQMELDFAEAQKRWAEEKNELNDKLSEANSAHQYYYSAACDYEKNYNRTLSEKSDLEDKIQIVESSVDYYKECWNESQELQKVKRRE
ncbi:chromosome partition protein Smc [Jatropha curcas]|uniref:chromosome partition protein Smc n=1 Tax=Jatropha curcas TaxID=180498 RepID=UPI001893D74C|nr:chromosome partition protein Smc [Jatropha curcas]